MNAPDTEESGAPDRPCATCGHEGHAHILREVEAAGVTVRETYCEECEAPCEFIPDPRD